MKNKKLFAILTLVCFMMTLMPVAAFAAAPVADASQFVATSDTTVKAGGKIPFTFVGIDATGKTTTDTALDMIIWAEDTAKTGTPSSALTGVDAVASGADAGQYTYRVSLKGGESVNLTFGRTGEYKVYAVEADSIDTEASTTVAKLASGTKVGNTVSTITVKPSSVSDPQASYKATASKVSGDMTLNSTPGGHNDTIAKISGVKATNVAENKVKVSFTDDGSVLIGKTVTIESGSANVEVNKTSAKTDATGSIDFTLTGVREGTYNIYLTIDNVSFVIEVTVGETAATHIELVESPSNPVALYGSVNTTKPSDGDLNVQFAVTDINGNTVAGATALGKTNVFDNNYVCFTEKPAASDLENSDLKLTYYGGNQTYVLEVDGTLDAEGVYTVKAILENGNYATATFEVKKFGTPVKLIVAYPQNTVELAGKIEVAKLAYVDANGVQKAAGKSVDLAATGHAIANFTSDGKLTVKSDEKYVGSKITVTAVDSRYNLVASTELTVADEAAELAFADKTAEVNINNKIVVNVVDAQGNKVALGNDYGSAEISYVVLDKPEGAKVSVYTADQTKLAAQGKFVMALTSDKIGNVAVQAVVKLTKKDAGENTSGTANTAVVKYYTGTQIFAVGNGSAGEVVVMSVGSNEIVINDKKATIDAAPIVKNDRTFVPFRALAEAFGAEVAYDEATQAVTAELNGVKVVMTIGSATYTVNGAEKTMDVAPFINGSRTMVPVRFVAEAFGIKVIPTYDENGATADILFNL